MFSSCLFTSRSPGLYCYLVSFHGNPGLLPCQLIVNGVVEGQARVAEVGLETKVETEVSESQGGAGCDHGTSGVEGPPQGRAGWS